MRMIVECCCRSTAFWHKPTASMAENVCVISNLQGLRRRNSDRGRAFACEQSKERPGYTILTGPDNVCIPSRCQGRGVQATGSYYAGKTRHPCSIDDQGRCQKCQASFHVRSATPYPLLEKSLCLCLTGPLSVHFVSWSAISNSESSQ
jgi:hypothetical protein